MRTRVLIMVTAAFLVACATEGAGLLANGVDQRFTRQELEELVAKSEISTNVDRACVVEHAWSVRDTIPPVGLVTPGYQPPEFIARTQMIARSIRMSQARDAGVANCSPAGATPSEAPH